MGWWDTGQSPGRGEVRATWNVVSARAVARLRCHPGQVVTADRASVLSSQGGGQCTKGYETGTP